MVAYHQEWALPPSLQIPEKPRELKVNNWIKKEWRQHRLHTHTRICQVDIYKYVFAACLTDARYISSHRLPCWNAATATNTDSGIRNFILIHLLRVPQRSFWSRRPKMSLLSSLVAFMWTVTLRVFTWPHWQAALVPLFSRQHTVASFFTASMRPTVSHSVTRRLDLRCHFVSLASGSPSNGNNVNFRPRPHFQRCWHFACYHPFHYSDLIGQLRIDIEIFFWTCCPLTSSTLSCTELSNHKVCHFSGQK